MRTTIILAASLAALTVAGCDNAENAANTSPPPETTQPPSTSGERAQEALGEAGDAARETLQNLGEAGRAGFEALQENAPEIQEGLNEAGQRLRNAAGALVEEPDRPDVPGDSEADTNETPEALESPAQ
jgi:hypothetical protein